MTQQHNHHCLIVAGGNVWRIRGVQHPFIGIVCPNGCCKASLDIEGMDFAEYCVEAVINDYANAARVPAIASSARN